MLQAAVDTLHWAVRAHAEIMLFILKKASGHPCMTPLELEKSGPTEVPNLKRLCMRQNIASRTRGGMPIFRSRPYSIVQATLSKHFLSSQKMPNKGCFEA